MTNHSIRILLVEDNLKDLRLTLDALQSENVANQVDVARDGEEALDYVFCRGPHSDRSPQSPPRLILLDLKLPKVSGLEVLRAVKADRRTKPIPVVILTSSKEEEDLAEGYQLGDSSNRRQEGTGLGLHLSRKLTTLLGGELSFTSEYGKGSRFTVTFEQT